MASLNIDFFSLDTIDLGLTSVLLHDRKNARSPIKMNFENNALIK